MLVDTHLEKPLGGSKEFDIKAIVHGIATNVEHAVDEK